VLDTACVVWNGHKDYLGYGKRRYKGKVQLAHRVAFFEANGYMPEAGRVVMHICDNPSCINPGHLRDGTHADNVADRVAKGRSSGGSMPGELHPGAKLSDKQTAEIRDLCKTKIPQSKIAAMYGVSQSTVSEIHTGRKRAS
jgi:hypothetical protein